MVFVLSETWSILYHVLKYYREKFWGYLGNFPIFFCEFQSQCPYIFRNRPSSDPTYKIHIGPFKEQISPISYQAHDQCVSYVHIGPFKEQIGPISYKIHIGPFKLQIGPITYPQTQAHLEFTSPSTNHYKMGVPLRNTFQAPQGQT